MPPIRRVLGGVRFQQFLPVLGPGQFLPEGGEGRRRSNRHYGVFLNSLINFLIIAGVMFGVVKGMNRLKAGRTAPALPSDHQDCPVLARRQSPFARRVALTDTSGL